jgi:hypothetical protein
VSVCGLSVDHAGSAPISGGEAQAKRREWQSRQARGRRGVHGSGGGAALHSDEFVRPGMPSGRGAPATVANGGSGLGRGWRDRRGRGRRPLKGRTDIVEGIGGRPEAGVTAWLEIAVVDGDDMSRGARSGGFGGRALTSGPGREKEEAAAWATQRCRKTVSGRHGSSPLGKRNQVSDL